MSIHTSGGLISTTFIENVRLAASRQLGEQARGGQVAVDLGKGASMTGGRRLRVIHGIGLSADGASLRLGSLER